MKASLLVGVFLCIPTLLHSTVLTSSSFVPYPQGYDPIAGLIQGRDGNFYGTTRSGGLFSHGTVFKITNDGTLTTLVNFTSTDGHSPQGSLIQGSDGNFYGTTVGGGSANDGTVFKVTPTGTLTTLVNFTDANGNQPMAGLIIGTDGNFYGTTVGGGTSNLGTVFKMTPAGVLTTMASFQNSSGDSPSGIILATDGNFYGTTALGGASNDGVVFKMTPTGTLTALASFTNATGQQPQAGVIQASDGNLYGTTEYSSNGGGGTVFKVTPGGVLTTLASLAAGNNAAYSYGSYSTAALIQGSDGNLYGTARQGGDSDNGTIFKVTLAGTISVFANFELNTGFMPSSGMIQAANGNFYGVTPYAPASVPGTPTSNGTVYQVTPGGVLTTLFTFQQANGLGPAAGLIQGLDGNFYGTTELGGPMGDGTVFAMTPGGALVTKASFTGDNGNLPLSGLIQGSDGSFYGTTFVGGGPANEGTVFKMTPGGVLSALVSFGNLGDTSPEGPQAGLVQGRDGNFYGTTGSDSTNGYGTVFKITPGGVVTRLAAFDSANGESPLAALVQGSDGNFYGTTELGGTGSIGTVFKITSGGALTTLVNFTGTNGSVPKAALIQGTDGNFYGTTESGGASGDGTVFQMTPGGALATLYNFSSTGGNAPIAGLLQRSDGNFYGTTYEGGTSSQGTIFELTPGGTLTTLVNFNTSDGAAPIGTLIQGADGNLYGTTTGGGTSGGGTVFRLDLTSVENITFNSAATIPFTSSAYEITGSTLNLALGFAPTSGTVLTVVRNTGITPIKGAFTNLPEGGTITASYNGSSYTFGATYSGGSGYDLTLTLLYQSLTFAQWETQYSINSPATATPENDGVPNLLKYLYDINPSQPMTATDRAALPAFGTDTATTPGTTYLKLMYRQYALMSGIIVNVQTSPDLQTWTTLNAGQYTIQSTTTSVGDTGTTDPIMEIEVPATSSKEFIRLNVTQP